MKIWFRIVICPSIIFFPEIFATITLIHKQIIAMAEYYACGAFMLAVLLFHNMFVLPKVHTISNIYMKLIRRLIRSVFGFDTLRSSSLFRRLGRRCATASKYG